MKRQLLVISAAVMMAGLSSGALAQGAQSPVPDQAFRAMHLVNVEQGKEAELLSSLEESNRVMAKLGCPECRYRLWKVSGTKAGVHEYMWDSSWPSRAVYNKIHDAPEWKALSVKNAAMPKIIKDEVYNRLVEVVPKK